VGSIRRNEMTKKLSKAEKRSLVKLVTDTYELALKAQDDARIDFEEAWEAHRYAKCVWESASRLVSGLYTVRDEMKKQETENGTNSGTEGK